MDSPTIAPPLAGLVLGSQHNSFVVAEWHDAGAPPGPPRWIAPKHVHHKDDEAWYVLEGMLGVLVGDKEVQANAGAAVMVPRGTPHTYWNAGPGRLRYLLVMTANIHQLIEDIHALKERTSEKLREVFQKHDSELL